VGDTLLDLVPYQPPDAALRAAEDGAGLEFNRPPRLLPPGQGLRFALPRPPGRPERRPVPVLMAAVPVVLGVAMAYFLRQVYMLALAVFSPVMLLGSYLSDHRHGRKSYARQLAEYREHKARVDQDAREAAEAERLRRRHDCPDPAAVLSIAAGPRRRLWERRRTDPDYLLLRAGTADLPSAVELTDPAADEHRRRRCWLIPDAPVTIPLPERAVVGVAGPTDVSRAAGRCLVAQIAVLHSPQDVQICILTDSTGRDAWAWARWLPHCRPAEAQNCAALIGNDPETVAARIAELQAIITARRKALRDQGASQDRFGHDIVVVFDGSRKLRSLPGAIGILREGGQACVYCICLDAEERLLPAECQAVAVAGPDGTLVVQQMSQPAVGPVRPEHVTADWAERVARSIAPVRDVGDDEDAAGLPQACRLLDVLGLEPPDAMAIAARWQAGGRSTTAVVGECYDGSFGIDLARDGPHALIAGTTGAGKSELLQTLIASLACANRPDAMAFVLVDYKGGSAFKDCVHLPHVTGMVTDLDAHLTRRALASLSAELTRRERILAAAGAKDIEDYTALAGREGREPLPRLVIVIDEFASLVRDLPDFVTGLVSIAQRGRSLGIHLILATQRPSGAVSADIRANTNLRIALRVTDAAESADVIEAPDAAYISRGTPGRAYVRLGHASLVPFQAGRIGGRRPGSRASAERPWVTPVDWTSLGRPEPRRPPTRSHAGEEVTDLTVLVEQIRRTVAALRIPSQHSPWLPPLPWALLLRDLPSAGTRYPGRTHADLPFGMIDLPGLQRQRPAVLSLDTFGHLMAAGAPRSGRSQLLRTIAASIAAGCSAADVHLYGIDCGNGALLPVADLPHCGAVVTRTQPERAARLLGRLAAELTRRQDLLAEGGFASIAEQRAAARRGLPHIIVLLDRWEGFTTTLGEANGGALTDVITQILSEGASAGVHLIMAGDRSLLAGRIAAMCEDKLVFKLADADDYALAGLHGPATCQATSRPAGRSGPRSAPRSRSRCWIPTRPGRPRPPPCARWRPGRVTSTQGCPGSCGLFGLTCSRRGSPSRTRGSSARPPQTARCGGWPGSAATTWPPWARTCPRVRLPSSWPARPGPAVPRCCLDGPVLRGRRSSGDPGDAPAFSAAGTGRATRSGVLAGRAGTRRGRVHRGYRSAVRAGRGRDRRRGVAYRLRGRRPAQQDHHTRRRAAAGAGARRRPRGPRQRVRRMAGRRTAGTPWLPHRSADPPRRRPHRRPAHPCAHRPADQAR
jgi:S-DNA-T family DNA segregation ATPase FtsK/SpoIIIE